MPHAMTALACPQVGMSLPAHCLSPHISVESCSKPLAFPPLYGPPLTQTGNNVPSGCLTSGTGCQASFKSILPSCRLFSNILVRETNQQASPTPRSWTRLEVFASFSDVADDNATDAFDANKHGNNEKHLPINAMAPVMNRGYGAFGGATLEKSKLDLSQTTTRVSPQTEDGGGGGDIGNRINHGGGDGGDDGGDDDDYFGDADDGDEGDEGGFFRRRLALPEVFDRKIVEAVLQEWYRTISDLPTGLRQAVEMGLISSAQMVRFMSITARPTMARFMSRAVPPPISRALIGRMLADPGFLYKMFWEQAVTVGYGIWWEVQHRGDRLKHEWDLAAANILTLSLCNAAIVWSLAPCRSYGSTFKFNLQNTIQKLPNNVFERSYPLREFDLQKRIQSFFYKAGELCLTGMLAGTAGGCLSKLAASKKENTSVPLPSLRTSALSYGAFLGLSGNFRYQLIYGAERVMQQHFDNLGFVVLCSTALRLLNIHIGDVTRLTWLGLEAGPLLQSQGLQSAYRRPSLGSDSSSAGWFISNDIFPLGFFGGDSAKKRSEQKSTTTPARRKVRRKVTAIS